MKRRALLLLFAIGCARDNTATPIATTTASATATATATAIATATASAPPAPTITSTWCTEGYTALDEETCYLLPANAKKVLIYLHGVVPPTTESLQQKTVQGAVKNATSRVGAAAIVPRGIRGIGPGEAHDWYAWPTDPATHEKLAPGILARLVAAKAKLETIAGAPFEKTYLAGSSNGAYFLTALALRGDPDAHGLHFDGYGAMSGGAGGRAAPSRPVPFYIGYGAYDPETKANIKSLVSALEAAKWPMKVSVHPFSHGARDVYIDEAFAFWGEKR